MGGSYNENLSKTFSKKVRNTISSAKTDKNIVYNEIFPDTKIKEGSAEAKRWQTTLSDELNYIATSPTGSATGFGATIEIIDDLIKNEKEARNINILEAIWSWFTNTMLSRREGKRKVIVVMTRWHSQDLAGKLIDFAEENNISYEHINIPALDEEKNIMLCSEILDKNSYNFLKDIMGSDIFSANYNQKPIDLEGRLYNEFLEYEILPEKIRAIENYTDTADQGSDYLAAINYVVDFEGNAYILDIYYTQEGMEITEPYLANIIHRDKVNYCRIESNNGGRGFSRNVERLTRDKGNKRTIFKPFHQSENKIARILTNATGISQRIFFPKGWKVKYKEAYKHLLNYQRNGSNEHDDIEDALSGVNEILEKKYTNKKNWSGL